MYYVDSITSVLVDKPDIFRKTVLVRVNTIILPSVIFSLDIVFSIHYIR
jgi:hypothetical protein